MRQFGNLTFHANQWTLKAEPHVIQVAKRLFSRASKSESGQITLKHSPAIARDLEWFLQRYPLAVDDPQRLAKFSQDYKDDIERREAIITGIIKPRKFKLAVSPREYQSTAAEVMLSQKSLLLGDEVGLGKTCTAICTIAQAETQPVCVVTLTHLPEQWRAEIVRFCPSMRVHIASKKTVYNVCNRHGQFPHVLIVPYSKLTGWKDIIRDKCKTVIWDEAQELRRDESERWKAAAKIADAMEYRFGLTGTPVYNFGGEFFNVMRCISPDSLGTWEEFSREWCNGVGRHMKPRIQDPKAFGSYLREHHLMIRRTRNDVGRELPGLTKITHFVDPDSREFVKSDNRARELARLILQGSNKGDKFMAAGEFDALMRQTTGISKAVPVAAFVDMIIKSGEPVILYAWHRACYEIYLSELAEHKPALYTGSESPSKKQSEIERFKSGETDLLIMSLRSGVGVDGLQKRCKTVVFGEFDWSPGVIEQDIGRIFRDGQTEPVIAYMIAVDAGADPYMLEVLGLKQDQVRGIRGESLMLEGKADATAVMRKLAERYLSKG